MIDWLSAMFPATPLVHLEGAHCFLRPPQMSDWREWADLRASSRAFLTPWEPSWPADALTRLSFSRRLRRQAQEWRDDDGYSFFIFCRQTGALVGGVGISNMRRGVAQAGTLGYWVGEKYARKGYVAAATALVLDFAFHQLTLHRMEAACLPSNVASRGVLEKLGFHYEGIARGYLRIDGEWCDHVLFAMLSEDWLTRFLR